MSKKLVWPLAKIRPEDNCPAIWLGWTVWHAIRSGLINRYLSSRENRGRSQARIESNKRDKILDVWRMDINDAEDALKIYQIGFSHNVKDPAAHPDLYMTPENLVKLGDKSERCGFDRQLETLREGPFLKN